MPLALSFNQHWETGETGVTRAAPRKFHAVAWKGRGEEIPAATPKIHFNCDRMMKRRMNESTFSEDCRAREAQLSCEFIVNSAG